MEENHNLDRHDRELAATHKLDRLAPSRRDHWPKDDRRSSSRVEDDPHLTRGERQERWPLG